VNYFEESERNFDEREHLWITIDIKSLPSTISSALASYTSDPNVLDILADLSDITNKLQVALNPHTLGKTLKRLAKEAFVFIKEAVALHKNTLPETLEELAKDKDEIVRIAATSNYNTPVKVLILNLFDPCRNVVIAAIRNPMTPKENVEVLSNTKDSLILYEVKKRLNSK